MRLAHAGRAAFFRNFSGGSQALCRRPFLCWGHGQRGAGFRNGGRAIAMSDVIFIALTMLFFGVGAAYVAGCRRLE
jgi:hypothetical protein